MSFLPREAFIDAHKNHKGKAAVQRAYASIIFDALLSNAQKVTLLALLDIDGPGLLHRPGRGYIAKRLGATPAAVGRHLTELTKLGRIRLEIPESGRRFWTYSYTQTDAPRSALAEHKQTRHVAPHIKTTAPRSALTDAPRSAKTTAPRSADVTSDLTSRLKDNNTPLPPKGGGDSPQASDTPFFKQLAAHPDLASDDAFVDAWRDWDRHRREIKHRLTKTSVSKQLKTLATVGPKEATARIEQSIEQGWQGLFELKDGNGSTKPAETPGERNVRLYRENQNATD